MKELLVISGKGGTGKTSIVGAFAALAESKVLADCDVDAADLHLLLRPTIRKSEEFYGLPKVVIDQAKCLGCGRCAEVCRFGAITPIDTAYRVDPISCEGCAVCYHICPQDAISMKGNLSGHWFISRTPYGPLVHAKLGIAEENSGKLVAEVRRQARSIAESQGLDYIITDGPPGIGCPVISSISGVDLALIITEPTIAGRHDMERILKLARHFDIETAVCINKYDLNERGAQDIEDYCYTEGIEIVGRIPFDEEIVYAMVEGLPLPDYKAKARGNNEGKASVALGSLWEKVLSRLG